MKTIKKVFSVLAAASILASCMKEGGIFSNKVVEGLPAVVSLKVSVPDSDKYNFATKAEGFESEVNDLSLLFIENGNGRVMVVRWESSEITPGSANSNGQRTLTLGSKTTQLDGSPILSGDYKVYALANNHSSLGSVDLTPLCKIGEYHKNDSFITQTIPGMKVANVGNTIFLSGSSRLPMVGIMDSVVIEPIEETDGNKGSSVAVDLDRISASVRFEFVNGTSSIAGHGDASFIPKKYSVYNLPKTAKIVPMGDNEYSDGECFDVENVEMTGNSFSFFMLENKQQTRSGLTYNMRDLWDGFVNGRKNFVHAPEKSTYVVVEGEFRNDVYYGTVSYTIHLGNMDTAKGGSSNNFSVGRNQEHVYTVTVNDVESIVLEAKTDPRDGGYQEGSEGKIVGIVNPNHFVVDAHYEAVLMEIPSVLTGSASTEQQFVFDVCSPGTGWEERLYHVSTSTGEITCEGKTGTFTVESADLDWVQFQKPAVSGNNVSIPAYAGRGNVGYLDDFCQNPNAYCVTVGGKKYATVFVDEYYYEDLPFEKWVNQRNRFIMFRKENERVSADGNSHFTTVDDFNLYITQRSIKTTYDLDAVNPFGIETWDETGATKYNTSGAPTTASYPSGFTSSDINGWANTKNISALSSSYRTRVNVGYLSAVADNSKAAHLYTQAVANPMQAMAARNRDLNGDGVISGDEIKWYIPAEKQFAILWYGQGGLQEDTRILDESVLRNPTGTWDEFLATTRKPLYTSTPGSWVMLQDAGFSSHAGNYNTSSFSNGYYLRCVRDLGGLTSNDEVTRVISHDPENGVIVANGIHSVRNMVQTEAYTQHTFLESQNLMPLGFEYRVSTDYVTPSLNEQFAPSTYASIKACENSFNNETNGYGWRVPNQRELIALWASGVLDSGKTWISSTMWTTSLGINPAQTLFHRNSSTFSLDTSTSPMYVVYVRDYAPAFNSSSSSVGSSSTSRDYLTIGNGGAAF